jgi:hypothetical protein
MMLTGNVENTCCAVCSLVDISSALSVIHLARWRCRLVGNGAEVRGHAKYI